MRLAFWFGVRGVLIPHSLIIGGPRVHRLTTLTALGNLTLITRAGPTASEWDRWTSAVRGNIFAGSPDECAVAEHLHDHSTCNSRAGQKWSLVLRSVTTTCLPQKSFEPLTERVILVSGSKTIPAIIHVDQPRSASSHSQYTWNISTGHQALIPHFLLSACSQDQCLFCVAAALDWTSDECLCSHWTVSRVATVKLDARWFMCNKEVFLFLWPTLIKVGQFLSII
jgi:hypothetical protein